MFSVTFENREFGRMTQPGLAFEVKEMRWSVEGGCDGALIEVGRDRLRAEDPACMGGMLRCPLTIRNEFGQAVWWGYLNTVEQVEGAFVVAHSLDELANKVAVRTTTLAPAGQAGEVLQTGWAEDLDSQALYGVKERIVERSGLDEAAALQVRDIALAEGAFPAAKMARMGGNKGWGLRLTCLGWVHSLAWRHFQPLAGLQYVRADSYVQSLEFVPRLVFALQRFQQVPLIAIKQRQGDGNTEQQLIALQFGGAFHP
jgi:hypothetical protein